MVSRTKSISMAYEKTISRPFTLHRISVECGIQLFRQVIKDPQVVVAREQMELDARIAQLSQFAQTAGEATGNCALVFEPKVE